MNRNRFGSNLSFIDMLFNILLGFAMLFFYSFILINDPTHNKKIDPKTELMVVMSWPDNSPHDIDLWLLTPEKNSIGYSTMSNSYVFLEHDDRGSINDFYTDGDGKVTHIDVNREVIAIKAKKDGKYVVNVQFFARHADDSGAVKDDPVPVTVELIQINPAYSILYQAKTVLTSQGEEHTMFTFEIINHEVTNIRQEQVPFVTKSTGTATITDP